MKAEDYPPQEPFGDLAKSAHAILTERAAGVDAKDFNYGADPYQSVAVCPAEQPNGDVVLMIHGGGWVNGYKEWMNFMAPALNAADITFVSIGYRLAPQHMFPTAVEDCMDGLAWTHQSIAEHGGDPSRLFLGGHSAGGHHSSLMAVRRDWQASRGLPEDVVRGCLPVSGVYKFGDNSGMKMRPRFLGPEDSGNERPASSMDNIAGTPPPFFIAYGENDFPHLKVQAVDMQTALAAAGGEVDSMELPDCDHLEASYACGDVGGAWVTKAIAWMGAH